MSKKTKQPKEQTVNLLQEQIVKLDAQLKHSLADYQNLQREHEVQKKHLMQSVRRTIFKDLIDLFSDLNIAVKKVDAVDESNPWLTGILQIMQKYKDLLKNNQITEIILKKGDSINYEIAQVIGTLPEGKPNTVAYMAEPGYKTDDYLISPAKVVVYAGLPTKATKTK